MDRIVKQKRRGRLGLKTIGMKGRSNLGLYKEYRLHWVSGLVGGAAV